MASRVLSFSRPIWNFAQTPTTERPEPGPGLHVVLDLDDNLRRRASIRLLDADYPGLIAEYEAGIATTVLDAAISDWIANYSDNDKLTTAQRGYIGSVKEAVGP